MTVLHGDIAVIGGGIVGLCLADELSRRGSTTYCFERGIPGHGQSAGRTRIFRYDHDDTRLVKLAIAARRAWHGLEGRASEQLIGDEGVVIIGAQEGEAERLANLGVEVDTLSPDELLERVPFSRNPVGVDAIREVTGGAIRADRAITNLSRSLGERIVTAEVFGFTSGSSGVEVHTSEGTSHFHEVFVTAGANTARLAAAHGITIRERRSCHLRLTFSVSPSIQLPCIVDRSGIFGETTYASPSPDGRSFAIGLSSKDSSVPLGSGDLMPSDANVAKITRRIESYADTALANALGDVVSSRLCITTPLEAEDEFSAWRAGKVTFFAGHNLFKFAPAIAEILANAVNDGQLTDLLQPGVV